MVLVQNSRTFSTETVSSVPLCSRIIPVLPECPVRRSELTEAPFCCNLSCNLENLENLQVGSGDLQAVLSAPTLRHTLLEHKAVVEVSSVCLRTRTDLV